MSPTHFQQMLSSGAGTGSICANACNNNTQANSKYCSEQCHYIHTLDTYRQSVDSQSASADSSPEPSTYSQGSIVGTQWGKLHTSALIRCGIDPWAPVSEIQMRHHFAYALIAIFNRFWIFAGNTDIAWMIENQTFRLSHSPDCISNWRKEDKQTLSNCAQRYNYLCAALFNKIGQDLHLVYALLSGAMHPSQFYANLML
ncbi:hypothetical protein BX661DRAFT_217387 [Kickxella alabastrina]|uniref:uncharacterized protein n=1 Tax=Kickxella alabastrina TaxID=61397 RepID=UPI00221F904C|nr:uncharacterized protein BX661DRAFT_217387 [Kickxella alabastrina]KAI7833874.1 hypothetical protein BX661DRAFT_217387 [Kickxella alabastrina]